jgi:predicted MPP superfamily phosphohydrolase
MKKTIYYLVAIKLVVLSIIFSYSACKREKTDKETFSIAFLTDMHLQPERDAVRGFNQALDTVNKLNPDFIITGGDLIMDALGQSYGRADSLYNLYQEVIRKAKMPVYNTMGNHEIYGIYKKRSGADPDNPEYGEKMFEKRIGESYYSFTHKGWKFMIINSIEDTKNDRYVGMVDSAQISWIKNELIKTDKSVPIVISTHIPFISAFSQKYKGSTVPNDSGLVVYNSKQVIDMFNNHNLKLVLQGHLHTVEDIHIDGIHFITGGAISSGWWKGPNRGFEEGFVYLTFSRNDFTWRYVDYGWDAVK